MTTVAIDFETALIRPGLLAPPPVCLTAYDDVLHAAKELPLIWHCYLERKGKGLDSYNFLRHILTDENTIIVGANIAFDLAVAAHAWPDLLPLIFAAYDAERVQDVQIREKLSDIAQGQLDGKWIADDTQPTGARFVKHLYSLADVAKRHGLQDRTSEKHDVEGWRLRYWELRHVPIQEWPIAATEYARADAKETWRVYDRQARSFEPAILADAARQASYHFALHLLSCRGLRTDADRIIALQRAKRIEYADVRRVLVEHGLIRPDDVGPKAQRGTRDIKAAQARMIDACARAGIEPALTGKGAVCLDADACALVAGHDPAFEVYARYLTLQNIVESQIPSLMCGTEKPIQPRFNVLVESGRTSCSAAKPRKGQPTMQFGFQVQNVRREPGIRECFRARDGYYFADADFSGLELCTMAQACVDLLGESKLGEALNAGMDPHLAMGASLLGISYAEAVDRKRDKEVKEARQLAKCFHPETEVLTRSGWVRVDALDPQTEVACPFSDGKKFYIAWAPPSRLTFRAATELVHLKNQGIDLRVTPDHRFSFWDQSGAIKECEARALHRARYWPNAGQDPQGREVDLDLLRMAVVTQADGSYPKQGQQIKFGFTKQRKIDRFRELFPAGWYKESTTSQGATQFVVQSQFAPRIKALLTPRKTIPFDWVGLDPDARETVLDELQHWDSSRHGNMKCFHYSSVNKENVDAVQAIASVSGRKTKVTKGAQSLANPNAHDCYKLSIKKQDRTRGGSGGFEPVPYVYNGPVYCLTTPTDHVLVRDGGIPVITKQCANFGFPGGLGATGFIAFAHGYGVELDEMRAKELKAAWLEQWPEFARYFRHVRDSLDKESNRVPLLKQLRSNRYRGECRFTEACNTYFQGLGADVAKHALFEVTKACYSDPSSPLFGSYPVNFVHDQIIAEVPIDNAHEACAELGRLMCEVANTNWLPDVPVKCEPCLSVWWSKDAVAVYGTDGRLYPWDLAVRDAGKRRFVYSDGKELKA